MKLQYWLKRLITYPGSHLMSPQAEARLKALREAPLDSWIALSEDETRIVAVGKTYAEAAEKGDQAGCSDPVIIKTPTEWTPLSV
jgi:hypothetical protein